MHNNLKLISSWEPFLNLLRRMWDTPGDSDSIDNEAEIKERIWDGIVAGIRHRDYRKVLLLKRIAAAACVVLCFTVSAWFLIPAIDDNSSSGYFAANEGQTSAGPLEYVLPDGTQVWLEDGSTLTLPEDFRTRRRVNLTGNATFDVAKVSGSNFTVVVDDSEILVRGTCFSVHDGADINLTLYRGAVEFIPSDSDVPIELKPSQRLTYHQESGDITVRNISSHLQWENGSYKLSQIELTELAEFIESRYDVKISLSGNLCDGNLRMTGGVRYDEPVDSILGRICYVFRLDCVRDGRNYVLSECAE